MSWNLFTDADHLARTETWIMTALVELGPREAKDLASVLNLTTRQIGWVFARLKRRGAIQCRGKPRRWFVTGTPPALVAARKPMRQDPHITADDLKWMAYWRLPRAVRLAQQRRKEGCG